MAIWFKNFSLKDVNARGANTMVSYLDICFTEIGKESLTATMPVDHRTKQPLGLLHGGALVTLAETVGSTAANLVLDPFKQYAVGLDINANHVHSMREGIATGVAGPLHIGRSTQVWGIRISNEEGKLVSIARLTMAVLDKKPK